MLLCRCLSPLSSRRRALSATCRKPDVEPKKGVRSHKATALSSVLSKWYARCVVLRMERVGTRGMEEAARGRNGLDVSTSR